jgi:hypothetical protein
MPVTILSIQENTPCHFYAYSSVASFNGVNRFYPNEYKPVMKPYMLVVLAANKKMRPMTYGCKVSKSLKVFSDRFENIFKNGK